LLADRRSAIIARASALGRVASMGVPSGGDFGKRPVMPCT